MKAALAFPGCHRRGGVERVMLECAKYLDARGHGVTVFANEWDAPKARALRFRHVPIRKHPWFLRGHSFLKGATRAIREDAQGFDAIGTFGVVSPLGGFHWVGSVHRAWIELSSRLRSPFSLGWLKQRLNPAHPAILRLEERHFGEGNFRKLIAMTADVKADLMRFYGVPEQEIVIIPNPVSPEEFNFARVEMLRDEMRRELGYTEEDRVVIFVANETERKGFGPLIRAIARLQDPSIKLLAVGRLNQGLYANEIQQLGIEKAVRFTGPSGDVARYFAAADVFALPTQYEAWGLVIVEALASGVPVLTSRLAGAAVTVREGATGQLLDDPQNVEEIAAKLSPLINGKHIARTEIAATIEEYHSDRVLARYEALLEEDSVAKREEPVPSKV